MQWRVRPFILSHQVWRYSFSICQMRRDQFLFYSDVSIIFNNVEKIILFFSYYYWIKVICSEEIFSLLSQYNNLILDVAFLGNFELGDLIFRPVLWNCLNVLIITNGTFTKNLYYYTIIMKMVTRPLMGKY